MACGSRAPRSPRYYKAQWDALLESGDEFPPKLVDGNGSKRSAQVGKGSIGTWFVPVHKEVDLAEARELIAAAEHGILFEFFNPGRKGTLFNAIMDRVGADEADGGDSLYVHGILNQDPEAGSEDPALVGLIHRGQLDEADPDIVLPSKVDSRFAAWEKEIDRLSLVMIHSKVVVLDPFGPKPVVMTGSHNLGPRASGKNNNNLNLIAGVPQARRRLRDPHHLGLQRLPLALRPLAKGEDGRQRLAGPRRRESLARGLLQRQRRGGKATRAAPLAGRVATLHRRLWSDSCLL